MKEEELDSRIERVVREEASRMSRISEWERDWRSCRRGDFAEFRGPYRRAACSPAPDWSERERRQPTVGRRRRRWWLLPVAASAVLLFGAGLVWHFTALRGPRVMDGETSMPDVYTGGADSVTDIEALVDSADYSRALMRIDRALADSCTVVGERGSRHASGVGRRYELTWLKIRSLAGLGHKSEALELLDEYIRIEGPHQQEALRLYEDILKQ